MMYLAKAFFDKTKFPEWSVNNFHNSIPQCKVNTKGKSSEYIPTLARASSEKWGVSICTIDGQRFSIGDSDEAFTMQAIG